jgi:enterobactin synthetase component D
MEVSPTGFRRINLVHAPSWVPPAFALEVDAQQAALSDFARHGVICPPAVERSVPRRRGEYLAGRRAARAALLEHGVAACHIGTGGDRAPVWPEGYIGSITHSVRMAAAVACPAGAVRGIGIDIEHVDGSDALDAIGHSVVNDAERMQLTDLAGAHGWPVALVIAFSAKESFYKATARAVGRLFDFDAVRLASCSADEGWLDFESTTVLSGTFSPGKRFRLGFTTWADTVMTSCVW